MNWNSDDYNVKNTIWSERCQKENKSVSADNWRYEVTSHQQLERSNVGPGSITNRDRRFLDKNTALLASLSAFVRQPPDGDTSNLTPEAKYVLQFQHRRPQKQSTPTLWAVSPSRLAAREQERLAVQELATASSAGGDDSTGAACGGGDAPGGARSGETKLPMTPGSRASPFGTSLFTTSTEVAPSRQRQGYKTFSTGSPTSPPPTATGTPGPGGEAPRVSLTTTPGLTHTADDKTKEVMSTLATKEAARRRKKIATSTTGDYGWVPPPCRAGDSRGLPDPRFRHPLPHTDVTKKFT